MIQLYADELDYVNKKLIENREGNSFLSKFLEACLRADEENYVLLRPVLHAFMRKYPLR
jgi:hypothetical protein